METIGLVILSLVFLLSGYKHVKNHSALAGYAASAFGNCPLAGVFGYLGGWPTGLGLLAAGVGIIAGSAVALYGAAAFLAVTGLLFHSGGYNYRFWTWEPADQKHWSLLGAALTLATLVG